MGIAVDPQQDTRWIRGREDRFAVAPAAQGAVEVATARPDVEVLDDLLEQNRSMLESHRLTRPPRAGYQLPAGRA